MNAASVTEITDFEVYLLMTMRRRTSMLDEESMLDAKLAEHGISADDAARVHERVSQVLSDESTRFANITTLLGAAGPDAASVTYRSVLWPGFDFRAAAGADGQLHSARYRHTDHVVPQAESPEVLPAWSMDVSEFTERFGPMVRGHQWPLFDTALPGYEKHEFTWDGRRYGVGFNWGLFLFSSQYWPE
jgi:hypothetical protein